MYRILQQSDVFADACAADHRGQLLFLSIYGRDTSVQQFMARLHVSGREGGIDELDLVDTRPADQQTAAKLRLLVGDPKRLGKLTGRMPRTGLLGNLVHLWIFDPVLMELDYSSGSAWLFRPGPVAAAAVDLEAAWRLVQDVARIPLLPHWGVPVMAYLRSRQCLQQPPCLGLVRTLRVEIPEGFDEWVSERVRVGDFLEQPPSCLDMATSHLEVRRA